MSQMLPVKRSKAQARRYYDRLSRVYQLLTAGEKKLIQQCLNLLAIRPGERVLEIGCGPGTSLRSIAQASTSKGRVTGVDLSRQMLLQSKRQQVHPAPLLVQADAARLPLRSADFDAVFCAFTLELFSEADISAVLDECRRMLKPAGRLGVLSMAAAPRTFALQLYELAHRLFPVAVDCRPIPLADLLKKHSFQVVRTEQARHWGLPITLALSAKSRTPQETKPKEKAA
jgi:ubiquinone/menaquinone biosynthesis C-methylase UbiE